jgi:hypothetical protein
MIQLVSGGRSGPADIHTEAMDKILTNSLKLNTLDDTFKANVLGFKDNNVSTIL